MRLLADENFPGPVIRALRQRGHDVLSVKESLRAAPDPDVLARAVADGRVLVTFDKDFGELLVRLGLPGSCGVILFRLNGDAPDIDNTRALAALESRTDWAGHFSVVTDERIRMRPLPVVRPS